MDAAFQKLALKIGIELPERFSALMAIAQSDKNTMRSVYDVFLLDAETAEREIDEWLDPADHEGRTFLPFATNGSGEPYCFVRLENGQTGIAQALHFGQMTRLAHIDISSWVTSHYVRAAADVSHLKYQTEMGPVLIHEVQLLHPALLPEHRALLADLFSRPCVARSFKDGSESIPRTVNAFISQEESELLQASLEQPDPIEFEVLRDWMR
ncbi:SMI1/KNR4 family protein [Pseudomonas quasicaspiana]|uniref:SMI1/KNR4 family protein n=1 Tax=Pseudomonas quasicaspiana TaxID=2829821 RepID=UPI001E3A521B|nr:SMI1/KNR4 family protein [Pseudomonas quasicaspiana]MCD5978986.1 SMI1/KNR4 family protein [Pseudomonas quasicaspiana]